MKLKTERLVIHDLRIEDAAPMAAYRSKDEVAKYQSYKNYTEKKAIKRINECLAKPFEYEPGSYQLGIYLKDTDQLIGDIYINISYDYEISLGYSLDSMHWSKGYMREAFGEFLGYLREVHHVRRVYCMVRFANERSINLLTKLGFEEFERSNFRKVICFIGRLSNV